MSVAEKIAIVEENVPKVYQVGYTKGKIEGTSISVIPPKDVNFYDYDGTVLHSFTVAEAQELTELPKLPEREGLICQGWNYDLETIKSYNSAVNVGAIYITDDGKTRLYITIPTYAPMDVPLHFSQTSANGVTIDWGDGSATETLSGTGEANTSHTYASMGDYVISLEVADGCRLGLGRSGYKYNVLGESSGSVNAAKLLVKAELGDGITNIGDYVFHGCYNLSSVTIPNGVISMSTSYPPFTGCDRLKFVSIPNGVSAVCSFQVCRGLTAISMPASVTSVPKFVFKECYSLFSVSIPKGVASIPDKAFYTCTSLSKIIIPNSVASIVGDAFFGCLGVLVYDFTSCSSVPVLTSSISQWITNIGVIKVPASLYDEWIAATNWSNYASQIVAV